MNNFKDILLEKLKVSKHSGSSDYHYIDSLEPGSKEKAEEILSAIKERYGWLFDEENMRIMRTNNIQLGIFKDEYNHGMYGNQMFVFYLNNPEYLVTLSFSSNTSLKLFIHIVLNLINNIEIFLNVSILCM